MASFEITYNKGDQKTVIFRYEDEDEASPVVKELAEAAQEAMRTGYFEPLYQLIERVRGNGET